jgi:hypothetical protein
MCDARMSANSALVISRTVEEGLRTTMPKLVGDMLAVVALGLVPSACLVGPDGSEATGAAATTNAQTDSGGESSSAVDTSAGSEGPHGGACEPTTEGLRSAIFEPSCNKPGCHNASAAGGLDLSVADLEAVLVGVPSGTCDGQIRVVAGDPSASFLLAKLEGTQTCGNQMPAGMPLDDALIGCVSDWIAAVGSSCETCGTQSCVDLLSDPAHCGDCTMACPAGIACIDSACACPGETQVCGDACVDVQSDPAHCGGCDAPCGEVEVCLLGQCSADCGTLTACDGACVDVTDDAQHCGDCNTVCGASESCIDNACVCEAAALGYAADIEPILADRCTNMGCHGGVMPAEGLDLRVGSGYADLVGVPSGQCGNRMLVAAGDPSASYLLDKLNGVNLCFGTKMPKTGPGVAAADVTAISQWICAGANP